MDLHDLPDHGQPALDANEIRRVVAKCGTTHFHSYTTLAIVTDPDLVWMIADERFDPIRIALEAVLRVGAVTSFTPVFPQDAELAHRASHPLATGAGPASLTARLRRQPLRTFERMFAGLLLQGARERRCIDTALRLVRERAARQTQDATDAAHTIDLG